jgi:hypothetical protein
MLRLRLRLRLRTLTHSRIRTKPLNKVSGEPASTKPALFHAVVIVKRWIFPLPHTLPIRVDPC